MSIGLEDVHAARDRIRGFVVRTPTLVRSLGPQATLHFKPENLQATGAFKIRGAFNLMRTLPADTPGVVAHSSGNHAQAVARAAKALGIRAVVVMPSDAPPLKRARTEADGAEVVTVGPDSDERMRKAAELAESEGLVPVPPYDHPLIMAGQGTAALELLEDAPEGGYDRFYCPVSGGGLLSGCATVFAARSPRTEIVAVEPAAANDVQQSLEAGERVKIAPPVTIADGLKVRTPGAAPWPVIQRTVSRVVTVTDDELRAAMKWALEELRIVLEPSGAASLAAAKREGEGHCAVLLSGGNVDPAVLGTAICPAQTGPDAAERG